jgi:hypothetical protein
MGPPEALDEATAGQKVATMVKHLSAREFAAAVGVTTRTVTRWVSAGKIVPVRTVDGHLRFPIEMTKRYVLDGSGDHPALQQPEKPTAEKSDAERAREAHAWVVRKLRARRLQGKDPP